MFSYRFCLFYLVGILCICLCVGSSNMKRCAETDKHALLKLKDGFIDDSNILSSWKGEVDCCRWEGISCHNLTGHVTRLDLQSSYGSPALRGKIDSSLCEVQHLMFLDLSNNSLEGNIPKCMGSLGQLIELKIANAGLLGGIPHTLGNLSNLQTLDLELNYLAANDLNWVSRLSNLRYLDLSQSNLMRAVDWASSISKVPSLVGLKLDACALPQLKNLKSTPHLNSSTSLKFLSLAGNYLNTSTLSWVLNVSKVLTYLDLSTNSLQHRIPDDFENMISLQYLYLSWNELEGSVPKSFQSLCQLKELELSSNRLTGQASNWVQQLCSAQSSIEMVDLSDNPFSSGPFPNISRLSSLKTFLLRNTNIFGPLPQSFGHLPYLVELDFSYNHLSGSLPFFEVTELPSLEYLYLSHNQLNGTLPFTIGQFSSLIELNVSSNMLNGVISEAHLSNVSNLKILDVSQNLLSFDVSLNWVPPFQLSGLFTSGCFMGPSFPAWLKYQRELKALHIAQGGISDTIPEWFGDLSSSLFYLNLSHNKLGGAWSKSSFKMDIAFGYVDLSFNNFYGPLPHFSSCSYVIIILSNNKFSGPASSFCATLQPDLAYLDLSSNSLSGRLPECWGQLAKLVHLNLAKNNFSGRIPKSIGTLQLLETIHLNNNNLSGEIPSLILCTNLKLIDFGDNNLRGTLPAWIGHKLSSLIVLRLQTNMFHGSIPASLCKLLNLQVIDFSQNNIIGGIPHCLNRIIALSNMEFPRKTILYKSDAYGFGIVPTHSWFIDIAVLVWKGQQMEYAKNLGLMTTIDLSSNHLTGEIPHSITRLVALASLNLSGNNLTGFIPNNIGHMKMLESLDLSRNNLYGRIPTSFSNLSFLSYMNLSFNNLSGKIPQSTQLQTFDASTYMGNHGLCGPPLTNKCPGEENSPNPQLTGGIDRNGSEGDADELITFGFYISLVFGFIIGFWGVCGTLILKSSWRHAYFQLFNNMNDWIYVQLIVFMARMKRKLQVQD